MTQDTWRSLIGAASFILALFVFASLLTGCAEKKAVFDCVTHPKDCN